MRGSVKFNVDSMVDSDPAKIRERHPNSNYEFFYKICISIPIMISFSLVFFMIFYISPRGESMQLFQKGIYEWNKDRIAEHMNSLDFKYSITPTSTAVSSFSLKHTDEDEMATEKGRSDRAALSTEQAEFEDTIRSIYYYQQSYFRADLADGIIPRLSFKESPPPSDNYCMDTLWKGKEDTLNYGYSEADDQPPCNAALPIDDDIGMSFESYKWEANAAYSCQIFGPSCELNCNILSGHFDVEDGNCYELKALEKICVKVDLKYVEDLPAAEALYVSEVKVTTGCFVGGSVALYRTVPLSPQSDGSYEYVFKDISVEVRNNGDPFTVFSSIDVNESTDLSIFFWLSMMSLVGALALIMFLAFYYQCYISSD